MNIKTYDELTLDGVEWAEFSFESIFKVVQRGRRLKKDDHFDGSVPYVSSTSLDNGVDGFIGNEINVRKFKNNLSLANSGSVGSCFYHPYEYIGSDHITALTLDNKNEYIYLFISTMVKRLAEKYSFNREINDKRIRKEKILLPVDIKGNPDWLFMENYIKQEQKKIALKAISHYEKTLKNVQSQSNNLSDVKWGSFWLDDIVTIYSGLRLVKSNQLNGKIAFIGASDSNNGITAFVSNTNASLDKNVLGVNYNGSVVENFYHPYDAIFSDDVKRLHWKNVKYQNKYTYLFLKTMILQQKSKFAYGYKFNSKRMERQKIMLPVAMNGEPDFKFMQSYMMNTEVKKRKLILNHLKKYI